MHTYCKWCKVMLVYWSQFSGVAVLVIGIWTQRELQQYMKLSSVYYEATPYVLIAVGGVIILVGSLGCCCTIKGYGRLLYLVSKKRKWHLSLLVYMLAYIDYNMTWMTFFWFSKTTKKNFLIVICTLQLLSSLCLLEKETFCEYIMLFVSTI